MIKFRDEHKKHILKAAGGLPDPKYEENLFKYLEVAADDLINEMTQYRESTPTVIKRELIKLQNALKKINQIVGFNISGNESRKSKVSILDIQKYLCSAITEVTKEGGHDKSEMVIDVSPQRRYFDIIQNLTYMDKSVNAALLNLNKKEIITGRATEVPLRSLIYRLCVVWQDYFNRKVGTSVDYGTGAPGGPLIRFINAYFGVLTDLVPELTTCLSVSGYSLREKIRDISRDLP